jgi:hypothetical protein
MAQTVKLVPPAGVTVAALAEIADNGLTVVTANGDGSWTFTAASGVISAQGNAITNPNLSDAALAVVAGLINQGWTAT